MSTPQLTVTWLVTHNTTNRSPENRSKAFLHISEERNYCTSSSQMAKVSALLSIFGRGEERSHVVKRTTQNCDATFANYCMNGGQCMLLVDFNEHHCKCHGGFYGPRCSNLELVFKPIGEEQVIFIIFCVTLLAVGLAGALYFCCKWYKKNKCNPQQKWQGYKGVQTI
ncbi:proepiregulin-like isoform X2 [Phyllopteryx taeniolatus]|uniref:proepiregulin-like isoform X2 n=1 Tax=Phyllopteryx taeniolatus TaxID=161469 RepID=UPI002AD5087B|nr:proepiregulin-like isoform X2 [Phyllopteryx taeniolatus]